MCSLSVVVYGSEDPGLGSIPHQVLRLMGAPLLLLLSIVAFAGLNIQSSSRREAIAA